MNNGRNIGAVEIQRRRLYRVASGYAKITNVYDGALALDCQGDVPTSLSGLSANIRPGFYLTCCKEGLFRLGADPVFPVTADAIGDSSLLFESRCLNIDELAGAVPFSHAMHLSDAGLLKPKLPPIDTNSFETISHYLWSLRGTNEPRLTIDEMIDRLRATASDPAPSGPAADRRGTPP